MCNVLGLQWYTERDEFGVKSPKFELNVIPTKREVLQKISEIFDPLGMISPVMIKMKIFMQDLWKEKLEWNDPLKESLYNKWKELQNDLLMIDKIRIKRFICELSTEYSIFELHCFTDASTRAYAAAVYLKVNSGNKTTCHLIFCKTKVAPVKELTIPRLELMGVLIGTRILKFVKENLKLNIARTVIWTDAKCVIYWLRSTKMKPVFIENRIKEIRCHSDIEFRYVPTSENPADLPTKGLNLIELQNATIWWEGPYWLKEHENEWPQKMILIDSSSEDDCEVVLECVDIEAEVKGNQLLNSDIKTPFEIIYQNYSSFIKLLKITSWALRFVNAVRDKSIIKCHFVTATEMVISRELWIKFLQKIGFQVEIEKLKLKERNTLIDQLDLFMDEKGLIRCGGRIKHAQIHYETKYPLLLPKDNHITKLIVIDTHENNCHAGVTQTLSALRKRYWIPHGRSQVKKIIKKCLIC